MMWVIITFLLVCLWIFNNAQWWVFMKSCSMQQFWFSHQISRPEMIEISRKTINDLIFFTIIMFRNVWQYNVIFQSNDLFQTQISCQKLFLSLDKNSWKRIAVQCSSIIYAISRHFHFPLFKCPLAHVLV